MKTQDTERVGMHKIRIGFIGCGWWATVQSYAFAQAGKSVEFVDAMHRSAETHAPVVIQRA